MGRQLTVVLDASAMLALLLNETGAANVTAVLGEAVIGAVNVAEVAERLAKSFTDDGVSASLRTSLPTVIPADTDLAIAAALLRPATRVAGLSLGDRFCLALGKRLGCPVLTADRAWAHVAQDIGVDVRLIR